MIRDGISALERLSQVLDIQVGQVQIKRWAHHLWWLETALDVTDPSHCVAGGARGVRRWWSNQLSGINM